ncbi:MAG: glycoside hydrolase family protein [Acidimicrobiales bacterium]
MVTSRENIAAPRDGRVIPRADRHAATSALVALAVLAVAACQPPAPTTNRMASGVTLASGQVLYSPTRAFNLSMQGDGNLVLRSARGFVYWSTKTSGDSGASLVMRTTGTLAVQSGTGATLWSTPTGWIDGATVELGDDANLVIKGVPGQPVWANGISTVSSARAAASTRHTSSHQVVMTKLYEGFVANSPYLNSSGNCTVGYGHLIRIGGCTSTDRATQWDADALFATDVAEHERRLKSSLGNAMVTQREFDALWDYVFNRGSITATTSPTMYAAMSANPPNYAAVPGILRANGNTLIRSLCDRRYDEADVFAGGRYDRSYVC